MNTITIVQVPSLSDLGYGGCSHPRRNLLTDPHGLVRCPHCHAGRANDGWTNGRFQEPRFYSADRQAFILPPGIKPDWVMGVEAWQEAHGQLTVGRSK